MHSALLVQLWFKDVVPKQVSKFLSSQFKARFIFVIPLIHRPGRKKMHIVGIRFPSEIAPRTFTEGAFVVYITLFKETFGTQWYQK